MPLYEYQCQGCGKVFEVIQRYSDAPITLHEECGAEVEKLLSAPAFQFKGTGWYVTDYGRGGVKKGGKAEGSEGKTEGKAETKTESKADGKTETKTSEASKPAATPAPAKP